MITYKQFQKNLNRIEERIAAACHSSGRKVKSVQLLPVTKNHSVEAVNFAQTSRLIAVGENRVQEAAAKKSEFSGVIRWELIGHLQSNKAKDALEVFDRIQSVDSLKLLKRLDRMAGETGRKLSILLQCNAGEDENKYGFAPVEMDAALDAALGSDHLQVDGLMTIAPLDDDPDVAKITFERLRELRDKLAAKHGVPLVELSMGMTGDLEAAIEAGSTQIRIGTALYGSRDY
ncbi:MAG: YggS family pyridoxal phosphate-dependent enzyme [Verrucomicrobiota bacterium]